MHDHYDSRADYMDRPFEGYSRKEVEMAWNYDQYRGENVYASIQETPTLPRGVKGHACDPGPCVAPPPLEMPPREAGLLTPYSALDLQTGMPCGTFVSAGARMADNHNVPVQHADVLLNEPSAAPTVATRQYFVLDSNVGEKQGTANLMEATVSPEGR